MRSCLQIVISDHSEYIVFDELVTSSMIVQIIHEVTENNFLNFIFHFLSTNIAVLI